jgi:hypothetical protein
MSRKAMYFLVASTFLAIFQLTFGCDEGNSDDESTDGETTETDKDTGTEEMTDMGATPGEFQSDFETSGDFFTLMTGMVEGNSPHGSVQIWYSTSIEDIVNDASFTAPEGTVAIKPFDMESDGTLDGYAVMVKMGADFDPDHNNWHYEMRNPDGVLLDDPTPGAIEMCYNCHSAASATDYLAGTALMK